MQRIAVALVDGSPECRALATLDQSKVQWDAFHSVHLFCARKLTNELSQHPETNIRITDGDYLAIYDGADRLLDECDADYLLVIPPGAALAFGFAAELERAISEAPLTLFGRSEYCSAAQIGGNKGAPLLKELFLRPSLLGPLLVNTQWARQNAKCWQFTYELWQWATVVRALATGTPVALVDLPFAFDALPQKDFSVPHQYAAWLREKKPEAAANLSNPSLQWTRMLTDIIADSAMDISSDLPSIVGQLYGRYMATSQRLAALEKELRELKSRKNKESL